MNLTDDEIVKWVCLFECLYNLDKYCKKHNIDYNYILNKKLKPNHINNYIDMRFDQMCNQIETKSYAGEFVEKFLNYDI